jgi:hypothetical protein
MMVYLNLKETSFYKKLSKKRKDRLELRLKARKLEKKKPSPEGVD